MPNASAAVIEMKKVSLNIALKGQRGYRFNLLSRPMHLRFTLQFTKELFSYNNSVYFRPKHNITFSYLSSVIVFLSKSQVNLKTEVP